MRIEKKIATHLTKCYSLARLSYRGQDCYLVASEKRFPCLVLDRDGTVLETVWEEPGGVMTLEPLKDGEGSFLATTGSTPPTIRPRPALSWPGGRKPAGRWIPFVPSPLYIGLGSWSGTASAMWPPRR